MVLQFKCEKCGGEIVVKYLKPGEDAQCRHCGAYVTVPQTGVEAGEEPELTKMRRYRGGWKKRDWQFVPCPSCGGDELNVIVFWSIPWRDALLVRYLIKAIPVKCKKCGAQFDGLTGCSIDEELSSVRNIQYLCIALYVMIGLFIVAAIILK